MEPSKHQKKLLLGSAINYLRKKGSIPSFTHQERHAVEIATNLLQSVCDIDLEDLENIEDIDLVSQFCEDEKEEPHADYLSQLYNTHGTDAYVRGKYEQALLNFTKAIENTIHKAQLYVNRAQTFLEMGRYDYSIFDCELAVKYDPKCGPAYNIMGLAFSKLEFWAEAVKVHEIAANLNPESIEYAKVLWAARQNFSDNLGESAAALYLTLVYHRATTTWMDILSRNSHKHSHCIP